MSRLSRASVATREDTADNGEYNKRVVPRMSNPIMSNTLAIINHKLERSVISGVAKPWHTRARARATFACARATFAPQHVLNQRRARRSQHAIERGVDRNCLYVYIYSAATKTYLRSSMSEQRLTDLAVLSIERDISDSLDLENVVDAFAQNHKNSRIVLKYLFTAVCVIIVSMV